jgi:hypothetical protein
MGVHHLMLELLGRDDVGQGYDPAAQAERRVGTTLGRHTNAYTVCSSRTVGVAAASTPNAAGRSR